MCLYVPKVHIKQVSYLLCSTLHIPEEQSSVQQGKEIYFF